MHSFKVGDSVGWSDWAQEVLPELNLLRPDKDLGLGPGPFLVTAVKSRPEKVCTCGIGKEALAIKHDAYVCEFAHPPSRLDHHQSIQVNDRPNWFAGGWFKK